MLITRATAKPFATAISGFDEILSDLEDLRTLVSEVGATPDSLFGFEVMVDDAKRLRRNIERAVGYDKADILPACLGALDTLISSASRPTMAILSALDALTLATRADADRVVLRRQAALGYAGTCQRLSGAILALGATAAWAVDPEHSIALAYCADQMREASFSLAGQ